MRKFITVLLLLFTATLAFAQQRTIRGRVTDATGEPLAGATIQESRKEKNTVAANAEGYFTITVSGNRVQLVVTAVGHKPKTISVTATAYTAKCDGCSGITSTGIDLLANPDKKVIAVDPNVIPLGTEVYVEGYGKAVAGDIGGAIKGNKIDVHVPTKDEAKSWGVRTVDVTILN